MLEAVDQLGLEGEPNPALYQMLLGALRALSGHSGPLVVPAFFLKVLSLEGFRPVVDQCVECGERDGLVSFDLESGGTRCSVHRRGPAISPAALALLNDILGGRLGVGAQRRPASDATVEVDHLSVAGHGAPPRAAAPLDRHPRPRLADRAPSGPAGQDPGGRRGRGRLGAVGAALDGTGDRFHTRADSSHCIQAFSSGSHWM